jgi:hypothetical protein
VQLKLGSYKLLKQAAIFIVGTSLSKADAKPLAQIGCPCVRAAKASTTQQKTATIDKFFNRN